METKRDGDDFAEDSSNEELYVSEVSPELEPIIELVGNWMSLGEWEPNHDQPRDLQALQEKLRKQEQLIHVLANASSSLLSIYYNTKDERKESTPENEHLKEEIMELTFRNGSLIDQLKDLELQLIDSDHKVEDLITSNRRFATSSLSIDTSTQEKLKDLQKENRNLNSLISELTSQLRSRETRLETERQKTKRKLILLQESIDSKDSEMAKIDESKTKLRKNLKGMNDRLLAIETEAEELQEELEENQKKSAYYKFLLEKSEKENSECREMLQEAKQQIKDHNGWIAPTRMIRHIQNPNSPYVNPDSLACELDKALRDIRHRFDHNTSEYGSTTWPDDTGSIPCDDISLCGLDCDVADGNSDVYYPMNLQPPMGQPGQPGTYDLDMAFDRLNLLQHWKRMFSRQMRPKLTNTPHVNPRIPRGLQFDCEISMLSNSAGNSALRSAISVPMQLSFNGSFEGLNNIGQILHSGVLIRGCETADVFEEINCSILDLEEDDEINEKTDEMDSNPSSLDASGSSAWKDPGLSDYSSSSSWSEVAGNQSDLVPTSKSNGALGHLGSVACSALQPVQGPAVQRGNLGKMASKLMAQNNREKLPDCVVS